MVQLPRDAQRTHSAAAAGKAKFHQVSPELTRGGAKRMLASLHFARCLQSQHGYPLPYMTHHMSQPHEACMCKASMALDSTPFGHNTVPCVQSLHIQVQSPHGFSWCSMTQPNGYSSPLFVDSTQFAIAVLLGKERFDLLPICFTAERNKKTISVATNLTNLPRETHCFRNITSNFMQCVGFPFFKQKCIYFNW